MMQDQTNSGVEPTPSLIDDLGITSESVEKFLGDRDRYDTSKQVCICGHAINKHSKYEEGWGTCLTGRHYCPCVNKTAVLYAHDTRYFMRKTFGSGSKHALSAGLLRLIQVGVEAHWLQQPLCWNAECPNPQQKVYPVPLNRQNQIVDAPGHYNIFLCETCFLNMKGVPGHEGKGWIW